MHKVRCRLTTVELFVMPVRLLLDSQLRRQRAASTGLTEEQLKDINNFTLSEKRRVLDVKDEEGTLRGELPSLVVMSGQTAMIKAAEAGRLESMEALVEMRASVDIPDDEG